MAGLKEKIGQLIMVGLTGEELRGEEKNLLRNCPFGAFILFSHNLEEPKQILSLCRSLWDAAAEVPPLIAVDEEGGRIHRLPEPFTHFPPAAVVGRARSPDLAYQAGLATGRELAAVGINLNFAPVFDVNSNPSSPVIGDRALSSDPAEVVRFGWEIVRGLREGGVIPCIKHFPGHGDTAQDSHVELPVVGKDLDELQTVELAPFAYASRRRIEAMMTAHVLYSNLDPIYPATLSRRIVDELLRTELRYGGVVFSDDLEMKAVSDRYSLEDAVRLAILAGVDALLFCHDIEKAAAALDFLIREAEQYGELRARIDESQRRIEKLKKRFLKTFTADENELEDMLDHHRTLVAQIHSYAS